VSFQGKPVEFGMIRFIPTGETRTPPNAAYIKHGEYRVQARGGVAAGTHKVMIQAFTGGVPQPTAGGDERGLEDDPIAGKGPAKQYLPPKYNDETVLSIVVEPGSKEFTKDWDLDS
jgi:hypothetical protein